MPGPLPVLATAALLLGAPAGVGAPPPDPTAAVVDAAVPMPRLADPAAAATPDGGALVAWSAPGAIEGRPVAVDGTPGPQVPLAPRGGRPALLARGDGRMVMAYSERAVRVRLVGAAGAVDDEHVVGGAIDTRQDTYNPPRAPALAWGPGRRWALVAWAQPNPRSKDPDKADSARVLARRVAPDGVPLGRPIVLARRVVQGAPTAESSSTTWESAAPTAATDGDGVLVVWEHGASGRLEAARIGATGHARPAALGLTAAAQRRALRRRGGRVRATAPLLLTRPGRHPLLAWGATHPESEDTSFRSALLVAPVPLRGRPSVIDGPRDAVSTDAELPTSLVAAPDGTLTVAWRVEEVVLAGRGCPEGDDGPPLGRRLDAALRPLGARQPLATGLDPRGPDVSDASSGVECSQFPGRAVLARLGAGTLVAYPYPPYLDARVIPD